jgi:hypothetical protein
MQSTLSKISALIGIVLMATCGSLIARHIDIEQWKIAGFSIGLLLCVIGPIWELRERLKTLENEIKKMNLDGSR